ncbi:hypothetical protein GMOD_00010320 [Pyrenophora seminiperda CCB06]|uniref:Uncharacterized protein n=1 Tax=Pyrenophora seminiperda CCB06 TaxID=1302712 RepID=A0A3M7M5G0_9PLEO|nr:hypothetical protein GMOD_00010320 [Pyrenophora seminiperda CCB06]
MATRPKRRMLEEYIRQDLLYRLRWNVFGALDDIEIATGPCDQAAVVPFFSHTLADESIAIPPFSRIDEVYIGECVDRVDHHYPEEYRYKPPPPMTINNEDGSPITLRQFVTQTHAYLNLHMEDLEEAKSFTYGELSKDKFNDWTRTYSDKPYLPTNIAFFSQQGLGGAY